LSIQARQLSATLFKNTILNKTKVGFVYVQEEEVEGLWLNMEKQMREHIKEAILSKLADPDANI